MLINSSLASTQLLFLKIRQNRDFELRIITNNQLSLVVEQPQPLLDNNYI